MKNFNILALALLGGQLVSAGWIGVASCDTGPFLPWESRVQSSSGCATEFWTEYPVYEYDVDSGEGRYVHYPVLIQEEMSFRTSGFSTITVHQRNQPVGIFEPPDHGGLYFSALSARFLEVIRIYVPGVPREIWVQVDWRQDNLLGEYEFHSIEQLDANELLVDATLDVYSWYMYPYPQNQDLTFSIERIRLFDKNGLLTGYQYSAGPEPGVMVGGTLWTPEPATFGLMAGCLLLFIGWHRFRAN